VTAPIIQMRDVAKHFGGAIVLSSLDWEVRQGQVIGLLGCNGAGKSTLMECLLGLRELDAGSVRLFGEDVAALSESARARIGYVPQKSNLFEWMTPLQLLDYFKAMYPRWNAVKVEALLERWGFDLLKLNKPIGRLSGGEQQRLSIIRALAHDPDLLVLDEPVSSLDPAGRRAFLAELVDGVIERGTTVVCCLMLPMVAAPLRDYAKRGAVSPMLPIMLLAASIGVSVILGFAASPVFGSPVLPVAALVSIGFAAIAVKAGLGVMERAPFAFPAARMA
jgi:ABC-2 type transport system ATP-binding protein